LRLIKSANGFASLTFLFALCAIVGLILAPFDALLSKGLLWLAEIIVHKFAKSIKIHGAGTYFFSLSAVVDPEYASVLSSLFGSPQDKAHWEWELFLYYLYWGVFANVFFFTLLSITLLRSRLTLLGWTALMLTFSCLLWNSLLHSRVMHHVHLYYSRRTSRLGEAEK
jgi:hypothetical protein